MATWVGLSELHAAFDKVSVQADLATKSMVTKGAALAEREAKGNFSGSHKKGEAHVGGDKPNVVTGNLRRSITHERASRAGTFAWRTRVGPTAVYGRRVELGYTGGGGRGHQTTRAFAYFQPGVRAARAQFTAIAAAEWGAFLRK